MLIKSISVLVAIFSIGAGFQSTRAADMTTADYKVQKNRIEMSYDLAKTNCDAMDGNDKSICMQLAHGWKSVAKADLERKYKDTVNNRFKLKMARAEAVYSVANARCNELTGNERAACKSEAQISYTTAKAEAAQNTDVSAADYDIATHKCDNYSGKTKDDCLEEANTLYGE
jgi:hypothetical protein